MRQDNGLEEIVKAVEKLEKYNDEMIPIYGGEDNKERLSGKHETASWGTFHGGLLIEV